MKEEIRAFKTKIHAFTKVDFLKLIEAAIENNSQIIQSGVNASSIVALNENPELINAYNNADLINIDGISMVWALRLLGYKVPERVACPDLAIEIMKLAEKNNYTLFLFGAKDQSLNSAVLNINNAYPNLRISGARNGYFDTSEEPSIVNLINISNTDILFLGMPSPQKELFVEKYKGQLHVKYILGVGGFFDIISGSIKRAPVWVQKMGMEWFYRFMQEPSRMWRRYLLGNIKFLYFVVREYFKKNK